MLKAMLLCGRFAQAVELRASKREYAGSNTVAPKSFFSIENKVTGVRKLA
jgi:hypothetical protein